MLPSPLPPSPDFLPSSPRVFVSRSKVLHASSHTINGFDLLQSSDRDHLGSLDLLELGHHKAQYLNQAHHKHELRIITMSTGDILAPMPVHTNSQRNLRVLTTQDLNASVNATLACNTDDRFATSDDQIKEDEYTVPDAPPPSPVMFRSDLWPASIRR